MPSAEFAQILKTKMGVPIERMFTPAGLARAAIKQNFESLKAAAKSAGGRVSGLISDTKSRLKADCIRIFEKLK